MQMPVRRVTPDRSTDCEPRGGPALFIFIRRIDPRFGVIRRNYEESCDACARVGSSIERGATGVPFREFVENMAERLIQCSTDKRNGPVRDGIAPGIFEVCDGEGEERKR